MNKPWYRKSKGAWYVTIDGKQIRLSRDESEAFALWHEMRLRSDIGEPKSISLVVVCEEFLEYAERENSEGTFQQYKKYIESFCEGRALTPVPQLKPHDVTKWIATKPSWGDASKRYAIAAVKRALNWALEQGLIDANPLAKVRRPAETKRDIVVDDETHAKIMQTVDKPFRLFLLALSHSGARPDEVRRVAASNVDGDCTTWTLANHKTRKKTGAPKVVYLSGCLQTVTRILCHFRPEGPLFRNRFGRPWSGNAVRCRMTRLREKLDLPEGLVAYSYRHTFTTRGLLNGVDSTVMAKLLGHVDTKMIAKHYSHIEKHAEFLRDAASKASARRKPNA